MTESTFSPLLQTLRAELASAPGAVVWPTVSEQIPDDGKSFQIAYMPPEWAELQEPALTERLDHMTRKWGQTRREFRNRLAFVLPDPMALEAAFQPGRESWAIQFVYKRIALPREGPDSPGPISFRVMHLNPSNSLSLHDGVLTALADHFRDAVSPQELAKFIALGRVDCSGGLRRVFPLEDIPRWFFTFLSLPRLRDDAPLRRAVAEGVDSGLFAVAYDQPLLALDEFPAPGALLTTGLKPGDVRFAPGGYLVSRTVE